MTATVSSNPSKLPEPSRGQSLLHTKPLRVEYDSELSSSPNSTYGGSLGTFSTAPSILPPAPGQSSKPSYQRLDTNGNCLGSRHLVPSTEGGKYKPVGFPVSEKISRGSERPNYHDSDKSQVPTESPKLSDKIPKVPERVSRVSEIPVRERPQVVTTKLVPHPSINRTAPQDTSKPTYEPVPPPRSHIQPDVVPRIRHGHRPVRVIHPADIQILQQNPTKPTTPSKRPPAGPLTTTSDEDSDQDPKSPRAPPSPCPPVTSEDYESVTSPGEQTDASSTCSGPVYERKPGFDFHAHAFVSRPKQKKKKALVALKDRMKRRENTPPRLRTKKESMPMRLRALPQSFWQPPTGSQQTSMAPAAMHLPTLPPLSYGGRHDDDITEIRPITPPDEKGRKKPPERKLIVGNVELLGKLFEAVEKKAETGGKRMRAKRPKVPMQHATVKGLMTGQDPFMVEAVSEKFFPQLSLEGARANQQSSVQLVTVREGDRTINLPALQNDQNYQQMLSELVAHI